MSDPMPVEEMVGPESSHEALSIAERIKFLKNRAKDNLDNALVLLGLAGLAGVASAADFVLGGLAESGVLAPEWTSWLAFAGGSVSVVGGSVFLAAGVKNLDELHASRGEAGALRTALAQHLLSAVEKSSEG